MSTLARKLKAMGACREAVKWAKDHKWPDAWQKCERGDWLLWLCGAMQGKEGWPPRQQIVLVACDCVELVLPIFEKKYPDDKRVRECLETTRKWANGEATIEDVHKARAAAYAAATAATATAAAYAAYATAYAAYATYAAYDAAADAAAYDAYDAADADAATAAYAAADAAYARQDMQNKYAEFCWQRLTVPKKWSSHYQPVGRDWRGGAAEEDGRV